MVKFIMKKSSVIIFCMVFVIFLIGFVFPLEINLSNNFPINFSRLNVSDDGLISHLSFDVQESLTNVQWVEGNNSGALKLDGVNDYFLVDNIYQNLSTLSFWFKLSTDVDASSSLSFLFSNGTAHGQYISFGSFTGAIPDETIALVTDVTNKTYVKENLNADVWYHLVLSWNGTQYLFYLNGDEILTYPNGGGDAYKLDSFLPALGVRPSTSSGWFNGTLDEFKIFNRSLNSTEIMFLYNHNLSNSTGLVGEWLFDESEDIFANDTSVYENTADIFGLGEVYTRNSVNISYNASVGNYTSSTRPIWNSTGYYGGSYEFDGIDDHLNIPNFLTDYPFTFSGFFKSNSTGTLISVGSSSADNLYYAIGLNAVGTLTIVTRNPTQNIEASSETYDDGSWHGFSLVFKNDTFRELYVDGVSVVNDTTNVDFGAVNTISVGSRVRISNDGFFNGTLDEIIVFNRSLNSTEVNDLLFVDYINNSLNLGVETHSRNIYKKGFDTIDFNFSISNSIMFDLDDPLDFSTINLTAQYSYDGVSWTDIPGAGYVEPFNVSQWSGAFGDSLTSTSGRWPPTHDGISNTNLSSTSGSPLQLGNPGWTCDQVIENTLGGNITNNTKMFMGCGINDINTNYFGGLSESESVAEIMEDYRTIVSLAQQYNVTVHFINLVAGDYTDLTGNVSEISEMEEESIRTVKETNRQFYDYFINNEHDGTMISYSDVWTALVDPSNNKSVLPIYGTNRSSHPSTAGNLIYADTIWSDNYKHKKHEEVYAFFYPSYPANVKFRFKVASPNRESNFVETGWHNLNFYDNSSACSSSGRYWYDSVCNVNAQITTTIQKGGSDTIIYVPTSEQLKQGYLKLIVAKQKVQVTINGEEKIIEIKSVDSETDKVEFIIGEKNYSVGLENSTKIDTNSDGYYDLEVSVFKVQDNGYAELEFKEIYEEIPKEEEESVVEKIKENIKEKNNYIYYLVGGIIFIGLIVWIILETLKARKIESSRDYYKKSLKRLKKKSH
jgi:Concanavalin A-like lectin/glucanases superfamily